MGGFILRTIEAKQITEAVAEMCKEAAYYLPDDVYEALKRGREAEESPVGRDVLDQIIRNAEIAKAEDRPICQDTGMTIVFLEIGQDLHIAGGDLEEAVNAGVAKGYTDFDAAVATPDLMGRVGRLGRVLGPRGLMPNPKTGTVTMDVAKAVSDIKGGRIEFRVDRAANLNFLIGKVSFTDEQLVENLQAALDEIVRLKPSTSKGRYILKATMTTTMGPGIPMDVTKA